MWSDDTMIVVNLFKTATTHKLYNFTYSNFSQLRNRY